jgi:hypothetical protein
VKELAIMGEILWATNGEGEVFVAWKAIKRQDHLLELLRMIEGYIKEDKRCREVYRTQKGAEVTVESVKIR